MSAGAPLVALAHFASDGLMGQQEYERQLIASLKGIPSISAKEMRIQPMRAPGIGRRVPLAFLTARSGRTQRILSRAVYGRADLVHRMDARLPVAASEVLTLHDLAPLKFADEGTWPLEATASARVARAVITPSEFAANEVRAALRVSRVIAIPNGVDSQCYAAGPLTRGDRQNMAPLPERFVVYAGGSSQRKNLPALAAAWSKFCAAQGDDTKLLICGPSSQEKERLFTALPRCHVLGRLERQTLLRLITSASALVVPSLYEGFGLPVLEAMAAGTVVVSARTSSLIEISGDSGILADPTPEGLAAGLTLALAGDHERRIADGRKWAARFGWDTSAQRHAELYLSLLAE